MSIWSIIFLSWIILGIILYLIDKYFILQKPDFEDIELLQIILYIIFAPILLLFIALDLLDIDTNNDC